LVDKGFSYKSTESAFNPIKINTVHLFNTEMNYSDFLLPCLFLVVLQQILLVAVCTSGALEKVEKTQKELYKKAHGSFGAIFLGKAAFYILIGSVINIVSVYIMLPINAIYVHSHIGLFLISTAFIIAMVFFAILLSTFFKSPEMAMVALMFYALPTILLSGFAWPHNALPLPLRIASYIFPSTYSMNSIRMFILGDVPVRYAVNSVVTLLVFAGICFCISYFIETKIKKILSL
jgi:ABC-2 type transport system permease protein